MASNNTNTNIYSSLTQINNYLNPITINFEINNINAIKDFINAPIYVHERDYKLEFENSIQKITDKDIKSEQTLASFQRVFNIRSFKFSDISEYGLVTYYDLLCRLPMEDYFSFLNYNGTYKIITNRNTKDRNVTELVKPDIFLSYRNCMIFKGEEKDDYTKFDEACNDLKKKECDFYMDYILCYAAAGHLFQFFVLKKYSKEDFKWELNKISNKYDLNKEEDRVAVVSLSINIARILAGQIKYLNDFRPNNVNNQSISIKCDHCDNVFKSNHGLKVHIGKKHK